MRSIKIYGFAKDFVRAPTEHGAVRFFLFLPSQTPLGKITKKSRTF
jgi:hypothetical protein